MIPPEAQLKSMTRLPVAIGPDADTGQVRCPVAALYIDRLRLKVVPDPVSRGKIRHSGQFEPVSLKGRHLILILGKNMVRGHQLVISAKGKKVR